MSNAPARTPAHAIHSVFTDRWSPRAFTDEAIPDETLMQLFEAAHWAPSSYNSQPWRFVYAKRGSASWPKLLSLLVEFNQGWARNAAALVFVLSKKTFMMQGNEVPAPCHSFDAGAAWASLALQATMIGWSTHGMVGFDHEAARRELAVPEGYDIEAAIAIGKKGDPATLPPMMQEREMPSPREPLEKLLFEGTFVA